MLPHPGSITRPQKPRTGFSGPTLPPIVKKVERNVNGAIFVRNFVLYFVQIRKEQLLC